MVISEKYEKSEKGPYAKEDKNSRGLLPSLCAGGHSQKYCGFRALSIVVTTYFS